MFEYNGTEYVKIGDLAKLTSSTAQTIRFYERQGLIKPEFRSSGGFRYFHPKAILIMRLIKHYKDMDFTLKEIRNLVSEYSVDASCRDIREHTREKIKEISDKVRQLRQSKKILEFRLNSYPECQKKKDCCIIDGCLFVEPKKSSKRRIDKSVRENIAKNGKDDL